MPRRETTSAARLGGLLGQRAEFDGCGPQSLLSLAPTGKHPELLTPHRLLWVSLAAGKSARQMSSWLSEALGAACATTVIAIPPKSQRKHLEVPRTPPTIVYERHWHHQLLCSCRVVQARHSLWKVPIAKISTRQA